MTECKYSEHAEKIETNYDATGNFQKLSYFYKQLDWMQIKQQILRNMEEELTEFYQYVKLNTIQFGMAK